MSCIIRNYKAIKNCTMRVFLYGACLSILIEGMQFALNLGFFEWDDIISNIVGTIMGYYIVFTLVCVFEGKRRKENQNYEWITNSTLQFGR